MNLHEVLRAGRSGFLYTRASCAGDADGSRVGYFIQIGKKSAFLIRAGTTISGGNATANADAVIRSIEKWGGREMA